MPKLSAGRVQSVATRIVVERERERMALPSAAATGTSPRRWTPANDAIAAARSRRAWSASTAPAWPPAATSTRHRRSSRPARTSLRARRGRRPAPGRRRWTARDFAVSSRSRRSRTRGKPYAPFMTSTLQQEAGRKLRFTSERTMRIAQRLYENGYITYMRTDSTTLSESAICGRPRAGHASCTATEYVPSSPRQYTRKVKNAQEAHEAIRPAGRDVPHPGPGRGRAGLRRVPAVRADLAAHDRLADGRRAGHHAVGADRRHRDDRRGVRCSPRPAARSPSPASCGPTSRAVDDGGRRRGGRRRAPAAAAGRRASALDRRRARADGHTTTPPARYTEPSLIKALEELGIGRPSTYASIIRTIQDRGYVWKKGRRWSRRGSRSR